MSIRVSVVIATYNRGALLNDLLQDLAKQTLPVEQFEVVVIDDGSKEPVAPALAKLTVPYKLTVKAQANAGPAAARDHGVRLAVGDIIVITDDDMRVQPDFLAQHVAVHDAGATVVLGHIAAAPHLAHMPVFERFHAYQLERFVQGVRDGTLDVRGVHVCTGNVSFRRADYVAVGGFDKTLGRSEDRELGVRLEKHGGTLKFAEAAKSVHESDHADLNVWLRRAFQYGVYDRRIAQKHPEVETADPWRFFFLINPISRPIMLVPMTLPGVGEKLSQVAMRAAMGADKAGLEKLAVFGTTLGYGLEYFRGMRVEAGSLTQVLQDLRAYLPKRAAVSGQPDAPGKPGKKGRRAALRHFVAAVRGDFESTARYRQKYHSETISLGKMPAHFVQKIGFQTTTLIRVMQLARDLRIPLAPQVVSRLIRHLYSAEIHWDARIAPGLSVVHGVGLVISHAATVGEGCILFQNVTLGEATDPQTRLVGAPTLGRNVHVGPGSTLLGPIDVGEGSKIMAGSVLARSVPPGSLVMPAEAVITTRKNAKKT